MSRTENESVTFHNENALLRIAMWSKVVGWVIMAIFLLSWFSDVLQMITSGGVQLPAAALDKLLFVANMLYPVAMGFFYFLIMQGLAQGLYIALDMFGIGEEEIEIEAPGG